jgi:prepilin-type N-terminal cleavage/methylation domain-containing protein
MMSSKISSVKKTGFTLVELSVVLVILGLLIAGTTFGASLANRSEITKFISDINQVYTAVNAFKQEYKYYPGDMPNATVYWSSTLNGNGNGNISIIANSAGAGSSEVSLVFQHMASANIYPGNFTSGNVMATSGTGTPSMSPLSIRNSRILVTNYTSYGEGGWSLVTRNHIGGNTVNVIRVGLSTSDIAQVNTHVGSGMFKVDEVYAIDKKIDDGLPRVGKFTGHNEYLSGITNTEACLLFATGVTHDATIVPGGGASYNFGTSYKCNSSLDMDF